MNNGYQSMLDFARRTREQNQRLNDQQRRRFNDQCRQISEKNRRLLEEQIRRRRFLEDQQMRSRLGSRGSGGLLQKLVCAVTLLWLCFTETGHTFAEYMVQSISALLTSPSMQNLLYRTFH
jgi:hypothetical protein